MKEPSDRTLLSELATLRREYDRVPTKALMAGQGTYSPEIYVDRFGSWEEAVSSAGLKPERLADERYLTLQRLDGRRFELIRSHLESNNERKFFRGQLLAELHRLAVELGETPSGTEMARYGRYSVATYASHFESWNAAIGWFGWVPNDEKHRTSDEELVGELRRLADQKGSRPSTVDMREEGHYSFPTYITRFGSWENACIHAGV